MTEIPTAAVAVYGTRPGSHFPPGATSSPDGVNFCIFSRHATHVELLLYAEADSVEPFQVITLTHEDNRTFFFWHVFVEGLPPTPVAARGLSNYWAYSTHSFYSPHPRYCVDPVHAHWEFRALTDALHNAGIGVLLDVVFNHTAEGGGQGPVINFKGLANEIFYHLDAADRRGYRDYTGCGNTVNSNHPLVNAFIVRCLEYWVEELGVDGFRFDLASVFARNQCGELMADPPATTPSATKPTARATGTGPTTMQAGIAASKASDPAVLSLRLRQAKNCLAILMLSRGVPMLLAGDEVLRCQRGNNNAYCQDNSLAWFDWRLVEVNRDMLRFTRELIALRRRHACLTVNRFFDGKPLPRRPIPDIAWHGARLNEPGWHDWDSHLLAVTIAGQAGDEEDLHVILNMSEQAVDASLPSIPGKHWHVALDTFRPPPADIVARPRQEQHPATCYSAGARSVVVLEARA